MEQKTKNSNKAFTLLEITVVISIIILLSTIFIANYRGGEKQFALKRSVYKLAQDLRRAEEMAMSSQMTPDSFEPGVFPKGGYGISFMKDSKSYVLFADCDGDNKYDEGSGASSCKEATEITPYPEKLEEIPFEQGIYIKELFKDSSLVDFLSIIFFPPDPIITINSDPAINSATISLTFDGVSQKTVTINKAGLIDIE